MQYAADLGVPLKDVMGWRGRITDRQIRAWAAWKDTQWNELTKTDWYMMRIAQRAGNAFGGTMSLEDQRITFEEPQVLRRQKGKAELDADMQFSFARVGNRIRTWKDGRLVYMDEL